MRGGRDRVRRSFESLRAKACAAADARTSCFSSLRLRQGTIGETLAHRKVCAHEAHRAVPSFSGASTTSPHAAQRRQWYWRASCRTPGATSLPSAGSRLAPDPSEAKWARTAGAAQERVSCRAESDGSWSSIEFTWVGGAPSASLSIESASDGGSSSMASESPSSGTVGAADSPVASSISTCGIV